LGLQFIGHFISDKGIGTAGGSHFSPNQCTRNKGGAGIHLKTMLKQKQRNVKRRPERRLYGVHTYIWVWTSFVWADFQRVRKVCRTLNIGADGWKNREIESKTHWLDSWIAGWVGGEACGEAEYPADLRGWEK